MSDPERALSVVKLLPVERISATSAVEEVREGLWSTDIHETFILARGKGRIYDVTEIPRPALYSSDRATSERAIGTAA